MKITLEFECDTASFENDFNRELEVIFRQARQKIITQLKREKATVCKAPEEADKLRDTLGNVVGFVNLA